VQGLLLKFSPSISTCFPALKSRLMGLSPPVLGYASAIPPDELGFRLRCGSQPGAVRLEKSARPTPRRTLVTFKPVLLAVRFVVFGSWCALGGPERISRSSMHPNHALLFAIGGTLVLGLVIRWPAKIFRTSAAGVPHWLYEIFNPNDKHLPP